MKNEILVWDGIAGELHEFFYLEDAKEWIIDEYCSEEDGIHPDIESIMILKQTYEVVVSPNHRDHGYEVNFIINK